MNLIELGKAIQDLTGAPLIVILISVYILGYLLKNFTPLNNKLIPWFLIVFAMVLMVVFFGLTPMNLLIGLVIGYIVIAFYEHVKNTLEAFMLKK